MFGFDQLTCTACSVILMVALLVFLLVILYNDRMIPDREDLIKGLTIDEDTINIPRAPGPLRNIGREGISTLLFVEMATGLGVRIETDHGVVILPACVADDLKGMGYPIHDTRAGGYPVREMDALYKVPPSSGLDDHDQLDAPVSEQEPEEGGSATMAIVALLSIFIVPGLAAILVAHLAGLGRPLVETVLASIGVVLVFIGAFLGYVVLRGTPDTDPMRVHEIGMVNDGTFTPWASFRTLSWSGDDESPFRLKKINGFVMTVDRSMARFEHAFQLAKERVADPRYDNDLYQMTRIRSFMRVQNEFALWCNMIAIITLLLLRPNISGSGILDLFTSAIGDGPVAWFLLLVPIWLIQFTILMYLVASNLSDVMPTRRMDLTVVTLLLSIPLMAFAAPLAMVDLVDVSEDVLGWYIVTFGAVVLYLLWLWSKNRRLPQAPSTYRALGNL